MNRTALTDLTHWLHSPQRKPCVIRGARQVGKTWLVKEALAPKAERQLVEINFERHPEQIDLFRSNEPQQILLHIEAALNLKEKINPQKHLLFLDEIQVAPALLAKLRWFAEDLPELPVIAAGSLLEFVLAEHDFSMPVGRINYFHLEPFSFEDFLLASRSTALYEYIKSWKFGTDIPKTIHQQLMKLFAEYTLIGGMPAVLSTWINTQSLEEVHRAHHDILTTYRDDFNKYAGHLSVTRLDEVLMAVPNLLGKKFVYSHVNPDVHIPALKQALSLLFRARVCHPVKACYANGIPLGAEINNKFFKAILLDSGLACTVLGLSLHQFQTVADICLINNGGIAEQIVGQLLRTIEPYYVEPKLYYWLRAGKNSEAEIDYLIQHNTQIIPIEVKAGSTGSLKSLHLVMALKKWNRAIRINSDLPSLTTINTKIHTGNTVSYHLISIPFYLTGQIHRLLD